MNDLITDPAERIGFLMWQTAHAFGAKMRDDLAELDLTTAQFGLLVHVTREPGISAAELARRVNLTRQGIRSALEPLLERDVIVRRPHPIHGRALGLYTTETGDALARSADARINGTEERMLQSFSDDDRRLFHQFVLQATAAINPTALDRTSIRPR